MVEKLLMKTMMINKFINNKKIHKFYNFKEKNNIHFK